MIIRTVIRFDNFQTSRQTSLRYISMIKESFMRTSVVPRRINEKSNRHRC